LAGRREHEPLEVALPNYTLEQITSEKALALTMGYLLPIASASTSITYGRIAAELRRDLKISGNIYPLHVGHTVGSLMNWLWELDRSIPLINALVVRANSKRPGEGVDYYLKKWFRLSKSRVSAKRRDALVERAANDVYAYDNWADVYRRAFGKKPPSAGPATLIDGSEVDGQSPFGGPAESEEHRRLKKYILTHPRQVGAPKRPDIAHDEEILLSADEVDVFFRTKTCAYLVEVKSIRSGKPDFLRGIYQCVKYRAVYTAQSRKKAPSLDVRAILVVEMTPPKDIVALAKFHAITLKIVSVNKRPNNYSAAFK
jgi:hypothetical protein